MFSETHAAFTVVGLYQTEVPLLLLGDIDRCLPAGIKEAKIKFTIIDEGACKKHHPCPIMN